MVVDRNMSEQVKGIFKVNFKTLLTLIKCEFFWCKDFINIKMKGTAMKKTKISLTNLSFTARPFLVSRLTLWCSSITLIHTTNVRICLAEWSVRHTECDDKKLTQETDVYDSIGSRNRNPCKRAGRRPKPGLVIIIYYGEIRNYLVFY